MAEVTERERELLRSLGGTGYHLPDLVRVAAYRESCVAEERAAREKAEQERDSLQRTILLEKAEVGSQYKRAQALEARLRAVIEAADRVADLARLYGPRLGRLVDDYRRVRDAASPEPEPVQKFTWFDGEIDRELLQKLIDLGIFRPASPEPEASPRVGHAFEWPPDHTTGSEGEGKCTVCGLPWSQHGGRDGE